MKDRFFQALLIVSTAAFSWLAMMIVHELGHVLHAWLSGAAVTRVVLHPTAFSRTELGENPHPLAVAWGGPIWAVIIPLVLLTVVRRLARPHAYLAAFFAGFCLVANGAYLVGDALWGSRAERLVYYGSPQWLPIVVGIAAIAAGLALFDGLGKDFGLGPARGRVDRRAALGISLALLVLVAVELAISP